MAVPAGLLATLQAPAAGAAAGGAAAGIGGALSAAGSWLAANPIAAAILADIGINVAGNIVGGASPYEQAAQQQMNIGRQLIPQLQAAAAGQPTPATQNIQRQLRKQTTAAQQSYAAAATARGGGGTPVAAQQARFRAAETEALGTQLGMAQQAAQAQLTGLYTGGMQAAGVLEQQELQAKQQVLSSLANALQWYQQSQKDDLAREFLDLWKDQILQQTALSQEMLETQRNERAFNTKLPNINVGWTPATKTFGR